MQVTLRWRYLLKLSAVVVAVGTITLLAHRWQIRKQVEIYLHHADSAKDPKREIAYLQRYLIARPGDIEVRERLGRKMCEIAKRNRDALEAYLFVEDVLRRDPSRDELRRFAVDFAMKPTIGLFAEAQANIDVLLKQHPDDGELEGFYARCLAAEGKFGSIDKAIDSDSEVENGAIAWYGRSIAHRPDLLDSYLGRAAILRFQLKLGEKADEVVKNMLEKNSQNFRTHLFVANYWQALGVPQQEAQIAAKPLAAAQKLLPVDRVEDAIAKAVSEARKLAPDELDVLLAAANIARDRARRPFPSGKLEERENVLAEARQLLTRAVELHGKSASAYLALASLEAETKRASDAVALVRKGLEAIPKSPLELIVALLDYQIRAADALGASETLADLRARGLLPLQLDYQKARILALQDEWLEASRTLEGLRQEVANDASLTRQTNFLLGRCYEQLGEDDRRLAAYRAAIPGDSSDPLWIPSTLGVAESETAMGKVDAALATYRKLKDLAPGAWVQIAKLEMIRVLSLSKEKWDWSKVEEAVLQAEHYLPDRTDVLLLRADLYHFRDKPEEARKRIEELRGKRPKEVAVWLAVAEQDRRDGNPKRAAATLDAAEKEAGDSPELRLARARLWDAAKEPDLPGKIVTLAAGSEKFGKPGQRRLLRGLADFANSTGAVDAAGQLWERLAGVQPNDLGIHLIRFDRAILAGDEPAMQRLLEEIQRIDREGGTSTRLARALILIWRAQRKNDPSGLNVALLLLEALSRERSGWARVTLGQALVYDLKGDSDTAMTKYQQAVEYGEANPDVLRRLMALLEAKGRGAQAEEILQKLPDSALSGSDVQRLAADLSLRMNNNSRGLLLAQRAVSKDSKDPNDHIWLGRVYWKVGDRASSELEFRKAIELRPDSLDGWLILIDSLLESGRQDEAEKTFGLAEAKVSSIDRSLFVALAMARMRKYEKATEAFKRAQADRPNDLRTAHAEANFLFESGQVVAAKEAFERVIKLQSASPEDKEFARWMVGICLAANRDYETSRKALELMGLVEGGALRRPTGSTTLPQRRARALVLGLQRDRASKLEAIYVLEEIRDGLTASDQLLLAQLYVAVGNRNQVRVVMSNLLRKSGQTPIYIMYYADWLLREGDVKEAEIWVKRLEEIDREAFRTIELRVRLYAAKKDLSSARAVLLRSAEAKGAPVGAFAQICEDVGLHDDAERLLKRFVEENRATRPQAPLLLAAFYGRRGRVAEGLKICEDARSNVPVPVVGNIAVGMLYAAPGTTAGDTAKVAGWLDEAAGKVQGETRSILLQQLASVRNLQGDYAGSAALYRQAIEINNKDVLALNNLAYLLSAHTGKHDDALGLLDQARKAVGPNPDLLDTEALVRLNKKEPNAARKLLEQVVLEAPSGAGFFHLALAEKEEGRELEARIAWKKSVELGLRRAELHPLEWPAFDRMAAMK